MKFFWPNRVKAKGFSIKNLSFRDYKQSANTSSIDIQNQCMRGGNVRSKNKFINHAKSHLISRKKGHWANRDFSEYEEVN